MKTSYSSAEIANEGHLSMCKKLPLTNAKRRLNSPILPQTNSCHVMVFSSPNTRPSDSVSDGFLANWVVLSTNSLSS